MSTKPMNPKKITAALKSSYFPSIVLFIAAAAAFVTVLCTNRGDMSSGVLILCGFITLITGVFLLSGVERQPYPAFETELMPVTSTVTFASVLAELGVTSDTIHRYDKASGKVIQINPISGGLIPKSLPKDMHFITSEKWSGVTYPAVSSALYTELKEKDKLRVPADDIDICISEVFCDSLSAAKKAECTITNESAVIVLQDFAMKNLCAKIHAQSVKCCTMTGCPICSLAASILAEGCGKDVVSSSVRLEKDTLTMVFTFI
ncbi:MAG TPA: hypothetical protein O0X42_03325 [Methanocorpusculum sp.]|nr:hypothetical protein [Methanocorpusculum sp.]